MNPRLVIPTSHPLLGMDVWYKGKLWRVVAAHYTAQRVCPWLTLKRGQGIEALAKSYEVVQVFN